MSPGINLVAAGLAAGFVWGALASAARADEPTLEECHVRVGEARVLAETLPAEHMSRYVAERYLQRALSEAGNGEFDECLEFAENAILEVKELRHDYPVGTRLNVLGPNDHPAEAAGAGPQGDGSKPQ